MERIFREYIHADYLQDSVHALVDSEGLIENGHHEVGTHRDPDLSLHRVFAASEEDLDAQVLLDPLEEQFDLPTALETHGDGQSRSFEVVGEKDQSLPVPRIFVTDAAKDMRIMLAGIESGESDRLVGPHAGRLVDWARLANVVTQIGLCAGHEESACPMDTHQSGEIDISAVHYVKGSSFEDDPIQRIYVVNRSVGNRDEHGDGALKIDQGMKLDRRLALAKPGPREQAHAKIDRGRVQCVDNLVDLFDVAVVAIQDTGLANKDLGKLEEDPPIPIFVGIGEVGSGDLTTDSHRIKQSFLGPQARFDVPQALPECKLCESHAKQLVPGGETSASARHRILRYAPLELLPVDDIDNLGEDETAGVHAFQSQ